MKHAIQIRTFFFFSRVGLWRAATACVMPHNRSDTTCEPLRKNVKTHNRLHVWSLSNKNSCDVYVDITSRHWLEQVVWLLTVESITIRPSFYYGFYKHNVMMSLIINFFTRRWILSVDGILRAATGYCNFWQVKVFPVHDVKGCRGKLDV